MGSRDSDSSFSGDENGGSSHGTLPSNSNKNLKKPDSPSGEDSVNNEPKSNNSSGSSEEGNSSGSGCSSGYANGVSSSSHSSESTGFISSTKTSEPTRSKYPCKKKDSQGYRQYHSEIEKKRRNKINGMIDELAELVPMCRGVSHKLDKLTVLKMTVQHMKMLTQKSAAEGICSPFKPPCISEDEMKYLLEQAGDGFLFVLSSDRAQILYISDAVWGIMHYSPSELIGRSLYDIVHSRDIPVIKDQLTPFASLPSINSARAARVGKPGHSRPEVGCMTGSRRSFFCRFRTLGKQGQDCTDQVSLSLMNKPKTKVGAQYGSDAKSYKAVHCTGFLKSWQTADTPVFGVDDDVGLSTFCCFIAIGRQVQGLPSEKEIKNEVNEAVNELAPMPTQFTSHHTADGKILFVDSRVVSISGFLPQDLVGQSEYDYIHQDDIPALADTFKKVLIRKDRGKVVSNIYRLRAKSGFMIPMRTVAFSLFNPFSKELEYIVHQNCIVPNMKPHSCNRTLQYIITSKPNADEVAEMREQSPDVRIGDKRPFESQRLPYTPTTPTGSDVSTLSSIPPKRKPLAGSLSSVSIDAEINEEEPVGRSTPASILLSPVAASLVRRGAISIDFAAVTRALAGTEDEGKVISLTTCGNKNGNKEATAQNAESRYYFSPVIEPMDPSDLSPRQLPSTSDIASNISVDSTSLSYEKTSSNLPELSASSYFSGTQAVDTDTRDYYSQILQLLPGNEELIVNSFVRNSGTGGNSSSGVDSGGNSENGSDNGTENQPSSKNGQRTPTSVAKRRQYRLLSPGARGSDGEAWPVNQKTNTTIGTNLMRDFESRTRSETGSGYSSNGSAPSGYLSSEAEDLISLCRRQNLLDEREMSAFCKAMDWKNKNDLLSLQQQSGTGNSRNESPEICNNHRDMPN